MKKEFLIAIVSFMSISLFAEAEHEIKSEIKKVTVFAQGAQIEREVVVAIQQGEMLVKLTGLSPYINKESIRIDGDGSFTILHVQHQNDFVNELEKNKETEALHKKIELLQFNIEDEETWLKIINEKLDFLAVNKNITGNEQAVNPESFKSLHLIYGTSVEQLNLQLVKKRRLINEYKKELNKLKNQLQTITTKSSLPSGTISINISSKLTKTAKLKFNYLVDNASWYPTYDIRFKGVDKPLVVTYKANVNQNTGVDWDKVKLVLSTAKTTVSAQIPQLYPFYLQFYSPSSTASSALPKKMAGTQVMDNNIRIRGASSMASQNEPLYIVDGMRQDEISSLPSDDIATVEVLKDASSSAIYGSKGANGVVVVTTKKDKNVSIPLTITSKAETVNEFIVDAPQTIVANNKNSNISYRETTLDATFEYQSIPKIAAHVYLIGKISEWYKADFLDGEVNVYLENSYVGKSFINTQQFKDTFEISFGIDNNISIKRERLPDYAENQFIGQNKKEFIGHKLTVRNNKSYPITTKIIDQLPISTIKEIEVEILDISEATSNKEKGELIWELKLSPKETKELLVKYSVKYPKDKKVIIE